MKKRFLGIIGLLLISTLLLTSCCKHNYVYHEAKHATCVNNGNLAYYSCDRCDKIFDENKKETNSIIAVKAKGHSFVKHDKVDATCETDGMNEYYTCENCNELFDSRHFTIYELPVLAKLGHTYVEHDKVDATCESNGNNKYFTCSVCNKIFDSEKNVLESIPVTLANGHTYKAHDKVDATYDKAGCEAYYTCDICSKVFNSEKIEVALDTLIIPTKSIDTKIINISNGIAKLEITSVELMKIYSIGDKVTIKVNGKTLVAPIVTSTSDVDTNELALLCNDNMELIKNSGNVVSDNSIDVNMDVNITINERKGYLDEYNYRNLAYTNARDDYSELTDSDYANFRAVTTKNMGDNILFRSSSLINSSINRNTIADNLAFDNYCNLIIDLDNGTEDEAKLNCGYKLSEFESQKHISYNLSDDYTSEEFKTQLKNILSFIANNRGVYLISGSDGIYDVGVIVALLEEYMGEERNKVIEDYMQSFINYYGIELYGYSYNKLEAVFLETYNSILKDKKVEEYFTEIGVDTDDLARIKANLSYDRDPLRVNNYIYFDEPVFMIGKKIVDLGITEESIDNSYAYLDENYAKFEAEELTNDEFDSFVRCIKALKNTTANLSVEYNIRSAVYSDVECYNILYELDNLYSYNNTIWRKVRINAASNIYKEILYPNKTDEEIDTIVSSISGNANTALLEYSRQMSDATNKIRNEEITIDEFFALYIPAANNYARILGYDNYLDYTYQVVYGRPYKASDVIQMKNYVKEYIVPLLYEDLEEWYKLISDPVAYNEYLDLSKNVVHNKQLLDDFYEWVDEDVNAKYVDFWDSGKYYLSNISNDNTTAWSDEINKIIYMSRDYQDIRTFVHEFGHYNADCYVNINMLDINEVQSQGAEVLFAYYLKNVDSHGYSNDAIDIYINDNLYVYYSSIVMSYKVAELEYILFNLTKEELESTSSQELWDRINSEVDDIYIEYDKKAPFNYNDDYYAYPIVECPGYYISYAVSCIGTLELYATIYEDEDAGIEMYEKVYSFGLTAKDTINVKDYYEVLEYCGLHSPFDSDVFESIYDLNFQGIYSKTIKTTKDDYPLLSDADYANFRDVSTTNMGDHILFRSSSLIDSSTNRNTIADELAYDNYCNIIIDLDNSTPEEVYANEGYKYSHFSTQQAALCNLSSDYSSENFNHQIYRIASIIANYRGVYIITGSNGTLDVGIVIALLEGYMGATEEEIISDYMQSYINMYGIKKGKATYNICKNRFKQIMSEILGEMTVAEYFASLGLNEEQLTKLTTNLSSDRDPIRINNYIYYKTEVFVTNKRVKFTEFTDNEYDTIMDNLDIILDSVKNEKYTEDELDAKLGYLDDVFGKYSDLYYDTKILADLYADSNYYDQADKIDYMVENVFYTKNELIYICTTNKYETFIRNRFTEDIITEVIEEYGNIDTGEVLGLLAEMNSLDNSYRNGNISFDDFMKAYIPVANEYAIEQHYDNYLDYRYKETYGRAYEPEDVLNIKDYIKNYIIPLYYETYSTMLSFDSQTWTEYYDLLNRFVHNKNILDDYFKWLDGDIYEHYQAVWTTGDTNISFYRNNNTTAYHSTNKRLFFGGGYQTIDTFVHEFGHLNASYYYSGDMMDIKETQSKGDELLFCYYLENNPHGYSEDAISLYKAKAINGEAISIIRAYLVAELEVNLYSMSKEELESTNILEMWNALCLELDDLYDDYERTAPLLTNNTSSFYYPVAQSKGYYISYGLSGVCSLELYATVENNMSNGLEMYENIYSFGENDSLDINDYYAILDYCGLESPFDVKAYELIYGYICSQSVGA